MNSTPRERNNATNSLKPLCSVTECLPVASIDFQGEIEARLW